MSDGDGADTDPDVDGGWMSPDVTRIAVDSAWGQDIGRIGWRVPLWNRGAARRRPQVYPFPDISFVTAAEGDGDEPLTVQDCLDPDFLYFYTDPVAGTSVSYPLEYQYQPDQATVKQIKLPNVPGAATVNWPARNSIQCGSLTIRWASS